MTRKISIIVALAMLASLAGCSVRVTPIHGPHGYARCVPSCSLPTIR